MGDCVCPHEVCSVHGDNTDYAPFDWPDRRKQVTPVEADSQPYTEENWSQDRYGLLIRPSKWLEDTCAVQRNAYNLEPEGVAYIKEQATAAIVELAEMLQSLPWKAARDGTPGREATPAELSKAGEELVDVLIFAGNIAVALGFDDQTIWDAVNQKAVRNVSKRAGFGKEKE